MTLMTDREKPHQYQLKDYNLSITKDSLREILAIRINN